MHAVVTDKERRTRTHHSGKSLDYETKKLHERSDTCRRPPTANGRWGERSWHHQQVVVEDSHTKNPGASPGYKSVPVSPHTFISSPFCATCTSKPPRAHCPSNTETSVRGGASNRPVSPLRLPRHPWACRLPQSQAGRSRTPGIPRPPAPGNSFGSGQPRLRNRVSGVSAAHRRALRNQRERRDPRGEQARTEMHK